MSTFKSSLNITFIGTATAILDIGGATFITDPVFSPAGSEWPGETVTLRTAISPAIELSALPAIDAVLLSHEDHPDNLDDFGRRLLDGRKVLTTLDGAKNLAPRPGVQGLSPWQTIKLDAGGQHFEVTATPCEHLPGGECTGFILTNAGFGETNGLPNAIYVSGDTIYVEELSTIRQKYHISAAILNLGAAKVPVGDPPLMITMDGEQAIRLFKDIGADLLIPMHFEGWGHFTQGSEELRKIFEKGGIADKVRWLEPGVATKIY